MKYSEIPSKDPHPECGLCRHWRQGEDDPGVGFCEVYHADEHGSCGCDKWEGPVTMSWDELARIGKLVVERLQNAPRVQVTWRKGQRFGVSMESLPD